MSSFEILLLSKYPCTLLFFFQNITQATNSNRYLNTVGDSPKCCSENFSDLSLVAFDKETLFDSAEIVFILMKALSLTFIGCKRNRALTDATVEMY